MITLQGLLIVFFSLFLPKFSFLSVHRTNSISYWVSFPTWGRWPNGVRTSSTSSTCKEMRPHKPYSWKCSTQRSDESAKIGKQLFIHRCLKCYNKYLFLPTKMPVRNHQPLSNCLCKSVHYPSFMNVPSWKAKTHFHIKNYLQMNFFFRNSIPREHRTTDFGVSLSTSSSPRTNWCWSNVERSNPSEWKKNERMNLKFWLFITKAKEWPNVNGTNDDEEEDEITQ